MLPIPKPRRKPAARYPFRAPLWDDHHPALQRIDATLASDHHARWLRTVVAHLDLTALRLSYAGYGALALPVELLLAFVLFVYSKGTLSPAEWARQARHDDQCKWLLRGLCPSRSQLYTFRDRVEPYLDDWHKQGSSPGPSSRASPPPHAVSLDGTFVAASVLASSSHAQSQPPRGPSSGALTACSVRLDGGQVKMATQLERPPGTAAVRHGVLAAGCR